MSPLQGGATFCAFCADSTYDDESDKALRQAKHDNPLTNWLCTVTGFYTDRDGIARLQSHGHWLLDKAGSLVGHKSLMLIKRTHDGRAEPIEAIVLLHALAFMQCKNVQRVDVTKEKGPTPKWCRRQRVAELKYHTIQVDPNLAGKPRPDNRKTEGDRSGKSLHICRGHFAHYVDDGASRGLFGRNQFGTFWVPAHTRGSLEHGRVISTYNVKTPA